MRSRIEPMKKIARSLRQHRELILNYFRAQKLLSSGAVEGAEVGCELIVKWIRLPKSGGGREFQRPLPSRNRDR